MGTTLGYGMNPFASASNNSSLANQVVGDRVYSQEAARKDQSEHSVMDGQMFDLRDIDSIKKTMLMQEDVFRQQVIELHRLYERQTYLMNELKKEAAITRKGVNRSEWTISPQPVQEMRHNFPGFLSRDEPGERGGGSYSGEITLTRPKGLNQLGRFAEEPESTSMRNDVGSDQIRHSYGLENVNNCTSMRNDIGSDDQIRRSYGLENVNNCTSMRNDIGSDQIRHSYGLENVNNCTSMRNDIGSDQIRHSYSLENVNNCTSMRNDIGSDQIRRSYGLENVNNCTSMRNDIGSDQIRRSYGLENVNNCNMSNDEADEEVDVELSLGIGCSRSKKRLKSNGPPVPPPPCSMDIGSSVTNSNGGGTSSSALTKRDFREQTLGESSFVLGSSSGRLTQSVAKSNWFCSRS